MFFAVFSYFFTLFKIFLKFSLNLTLILTPISYSYYLVGIFVFIFCRKLLYFLSRGSYAG